MRVVDRFVWDYLLTGDHMKTINETFTDTEYGDLRQVKKTRYHVARIHLEREYEDLSQRLD
jgi:hypothetical protein